MFARKIYLVHKKLQKYSKYYPKYQSLYICEPLRLKSLRRLIGCHNAHSRSVLFVQPSLPTKVLLLGSLGRCNEKGKYLLDAIIDNYFTVRCKLVPEKSSILNLIGQVLPVAQINFVNQSPITWMPKGSTDSTSIHEKQRF